MENMIQISDKQAFIEEAKVNRQKCYDIADEMCKAVSTQPSALKQYLDVQANLPKYSANNVLIIMKQKPNATYIADYQYWKRKNITLKKDEYAKPILILEKGNEYTKRDGGTGVYFNAKKMYDVTQTNARYGASRPNYRVEDLVKALTKNSSVVFRNVDANELPQDYFAYYDTKSNTILVKNNIGSNENVFKHISMEMAHAIMAQNNPSYSHENNHIKAYCASYMLCKQYGLNTDNYQIDFVMCNEHTPSFKIKKQLSDIKNVTANLSSRIEQVLSKSNRSYER